MNKHCKKKLALDTNVLIYVFDEQAIHHQWAVQNLQQYLDQGYELVITHQIVMECLSVMVKTMGIKKNLAINKIQELLSSNISVVYPQASTLTFALELINQQKKTNIFFDMYLVATLLDNQIDILLTKNVKDFSGVKELKIAN